MDVDNLSNMASMELGSNGLGGLLRCVVGWNCSTEMKALTNCKHYIDNRLFSDRNRDPNLIAHYIYV